MTLATDLDGKYVVISKGGVESSKPKQSDGMTLIKDGKTVRIDGSGCEWHSTFEWADDNHVKMISIVNPIYANPNFRLIGPDGEPTTEPQTYEALLQVKDKSGLAELSGTTAIGGETIHLILRKAES